MKFYQTTWFIVLMLFLFAPVGIFLMWKFKPNWNKTAKCILSAVFDFCFLLCCMVAFMPTGEAEPSSSAPVVSTSFAATQTQAETQTETTTEETTRETTTAAPTAATTKKAASGDSGDKQSAETTKKQSVTQNPDEKITVYITKTGKKYHYENPCGNGTYYPISLAEAKDRGYDPCEKCVLH